MAILENREAAARQDSYSWREYDEHFRLRQAITPVPRSKINKYLCWRCMQIKPAMKGTSELKKYTCKSFNSGSCTSLNCKFSHI